MPLMERDRLLARLSTTKAHIENGKVRVAAQKRVLIDLKGAGKSTTEAENLLWWLEFDQKNNVTAGERLLGALNDLSLVREAA